MKYNVEVDLSVGTSHSLILSRIEPNSRVLEFGPASGYMTQHMSQNLGCKVYCVEIDEDAAKHAEKYAEKMIVADIDQMMWFSELEKEQFDYILFADVLEHLRNPSFILERVTALLYDSGKIITSVPNISHNAIIMELLQGRFEYQPTGLLDETHIKFFTKKNVLKMLEFANLAPIEWLVTQRKPETTEFKQDYRYFPIDVREYLKSRPDGDVYQYVTVSGKKGFVSNEAVFEKEHVNYLDSDYIQVFWGSITTFSEQNSIRVVHEKSDGVVRYKIAFPQEAYGKIRIDPANIIICGEIEDIEIYSFEDTKNVLYSWNKSTCNIECNGIVPVQSTKSFSFIGTNNDPWLIINDFELEKSDTPHFIEIKMAINNDLSYVLTHLLKEHERNGEFQKRFLNEMVVNSEKQNKIDQLIQENIQYKSELQKLTKIHEDLVLVLEKTVGIQTVLDNQFNTLETNTKLLLNQKDELIMIRVNVTKPNIIKRILRKIRIKLLSR